MVAILFLLRKIYIYYFFDVASIALSSLYKSCY